MIKKSITAKINKVIKIGSLEEDQVKELQALEAIFPTEESKERKSEQPGESEEKPE